MRRIVLIMLCFLLCFLVGCNGRYKTIDEEKIVSAEVWTHNGNYELNDDELTEVIKLYNASEYQGKATGEGGTPEFGVIISFENGDWLYVNEFCGKSGDFEAFYKATKAFYLDNEELLSYVRELCEDNIE